MAEQNPLDFGDLFFVLMTALVIWVVYRLVHDPNFFRNWGRTFARGGLYFAFAEMVLKPRFLRDIDKSLDREEEEALKDAEYDAYAREQTSFPLTPELFVDRIKPHPALVALFVELARTLPSDREFLYDDYAQRTIIEAYTKLAALLAPLIVSDPPALFSTARIARAPSGFEDRLWPIMADCRLGFLSTTPDTPLSRFLYEPVPSDIPQNKRFEHTFILGGSGAGKTSLLEMMIRDDLKADHSVVVIDSHGQLIPKLARLARWKNKPVIIIDPRDKPALNVFDVKIQGNQEQIFNTTAQSLKFLLSGLLGIPLTAIQTGLFNYCIRLLLTYPKIYKRNATLHDLLALMRMRKIEVPISHLDAEDQDFFLNDFNNQQYTSTKNEVMVKLRAVLGYKLISSLVAAPFSTVDFFYAFNKGAVILVDTSYAYLQKDSSSYMGQIVFTLIMNAIFQRGLYENRKFPPVFVYVDEAHEYFNAPINEFLTGARKYRAGLTLSTQGMALMSDPLRAAVASSTSIKFAGKAGADGATWMAKNMRTDADFILNQPPYHFACHVDGMQNSVSLSTVPDALDAEPKLSDKEYKTLRQINRYYVSGQAWQKQEDPGFYDRDPYEPPKREREAKHPAEEGLALPAPDALSDETNW